MMTGIWGHSVKEAAAMRSSCSGNKSEVGEGHIVTGEVGHRVKRGSDLAQQLCQREPRSPSRRHGRPVERHPACRLLCLRLKLLERQPSPLALLPALGVVGVASGTSHPPAHELYGPPLGEGAPPLLAADAVVLVHV